MTSSSSDVSVCGPRTTALDAETDALRASMATMREREERLMELLHTKVPEKIEHDLRNVLNELVLLRTLLDLKSSN